MDLNGGMDLNSLLFLIFFLAGNMDLVIILAFLCLFEIILGYIFYNRCISKEGITDISNKEKLSDILLSTFISGVVYVFLNFSLLLVFLFDEYLGGYPSKYLGEHFEDLLRYLYNPLIRASFVIIPVVVYYLLLKYVRLNHRISYRLSHKLHKKTGEEITANTPSFTFWCDVFLLGLLLGTIIFTFLIFRFFSTIYIETITLKLKDLIFLKLLVKF